MTALQPHGRHLTHDGLAAYVSAGVSAALKIDGTPVAYVILEPSCNSVALRVPAGPRGIPELTGYRHISTARVHWNDRPWHEVRVEGSPLNASYPVICGITDRIQLDGREFSQAVVESLTALHRLFATAARLAEEEEIGLFGEVCVLQHLVQRMGARAAVASWRGPDGEEHDFDIEGGDVEVKTTLSESRRHWISHIAQLQPTLERPLSLLSLQLTTAAEGGVDLPTLIGAVASTLDDAKSTSVFERCLEAVGWRAEDAELYRRRFRLRSRPALYTVDAVFPALTTARLAAAAIDALRIPQIRYMVDLDGLTPAVEVPAPLRDFCLEYEA